MQPVDIAAVNEAVHARFIATLEDAMVAFTALDCAGALRAWASLGEQIATHQAIEEELLAALESCDVTAPRGGASSLVLAEHARLEHLHRIAAQQIAHVAESAGDGPAEQGSQRLAMVRVLDDLLRLRHLLEHHGLRETQIVYPHIAATLAPSVLAEFAERLRTFELNAAHA